MDQPLTRRAATEVLGTFWLVLGGCGSAVLAGKFLSGNVNLGIGFLGVSFAFGLTVLTIAYAIGHISGGHLNPAVTIGFWVSKRFPGKDVAAYIIAQVIGAILAAVVLFSIAQGSPDGVGFTSGAGGAPIAGAFATNGYGDLSPGGYTMIAALVTELILTFGFVFVILGSTERRAPKGFAPIAIGLALTLVHLISIPVTNTSVNPARSTGPALMALVSGQTEYFVQLWMFWFAPIAGALLAGLSYKLFAGETKEEEAVEPAEID